MGILNLRQFLKKKCGDFEKIVSLKNFSNKTVCIDANMYMCVYKAVCNTENKFKETFINLFLSLIEAKIKVIIVFDGKSPEEKNTEKQKRLTKKKASETRITSYTDDIKEYENSGIVSPGLSQLYKKVLSKTNDEVETIRRQDLDKIKAHVEKQRSHIIKITKTDFQIVKDLSKIFGFAVVTAPSEGEILCAYLVKNNYADAVFTRDTDVLACAIPTMITKINVVTKKATIINSNDILTKLKLSEAQMLDFCILCGTDYNSNINRVGCVRALQLINKHGNLETIEKSETKLDTSVLNYHVTRKLFTNVDIEIQSLDVSNSAVDYKSLREYIDAYKLEILSVYSNIEELSIGKLSKLNVHISEDNDNKVDAEQVDTN